MTAKKEFTVVKRWTAAEEAALKAGIRKYGAGAWVRIRDDKEFGHFLERRTGMQLKDKWRNLLKFGHITEAEGRSCLEKVIAVVEQQRQFVPWYTLPTQRYELRF